jgi:hypothetical protein
MRASEFQSCQNLVQRQWNTKDREVRLLGYLAYDDKVSGKRPGVIVIPQACGPGVHSRSHRFRPSKAEPAPYLNPKCRDCRCL